MSFSPTFVRLLGLDSPRSRCPPTVCHATDGMIEFMAAVGWHIADPDLFPVLGKRLLSGTFRWISNKHLSPGKIETRKHDQPHMVD